MFVPDACEEVHSDHEGFLLAGTPESMRDQLRPNAASQRHFTTRQSIA
jgi:hypothetical protein